jgi:hypothetical protein
MALQAPLATCSDSRSLGRDRGPAGAHERATAWRCVVRSMAIIAQVDVVYATGPDLSRRGGGVRGNPDAAEDRDEEAQKRVLGHSAHGQNARENESIRRCSPRSLSCRHRPQS